MYLHNVNIGRHSPDSRPIQVIPCHSPAQLLRAAALAGEPVHLLAFRAGASGIARVGRGGVATAYTDKLLRSPDRRAGRRPGRRSRRRRKHASELVAQHTIRATHDLLRHSFPSPSLLVTDSSQPWPSPHARRTSRGGTEQNTRPLQRIRTSVVRLPH